MIGIQRQIGYILLLLCLSLVPFHFTLSDRGFTYYRELIGSIFLFLLLIEIFKERYVSLKIRKEIFFLLLFPFLLIATVFYDTGIPLYRGETGLQGITNTEVININPRLYVLRNALLYLPMVFYLAFRGITEKEIQRLCLVSIIVAPFSILLYLLTVYEDSTFSIFLLGEMGQFGGLGIQYNSYVPYLTFPGLAGIYLLSDKNSLIVKSLVISSLAIMTLFIFFSSSRQALLFLLISLFCFFIMDRSNKTLTRLVLFSFAGLCFYFFFLFVMSDFDLSKSLTSKYSSVGKTSRLDIMVDGLKLLNPYEYLFGAGLTSVLNSGPHNDYIRWTQKVGVIIMTISFIPFFMAAYKSFLKLRHRNGRTIDLFIGLSIFFMIFHSMFGYPREDAYQAVWAFLGIALWLGYSNKFRKRYT